MKIKFEAGRGRFAVSARDIEVGELIAVENAFVALIDKVLMEFRTCRTGFYELRGTLLNYLAPVQILNHLFTLQLIT